MFRLVLGRSVVVASLFFGAAFAHGAVAPQRIAAAVDNAKVATMPGGVHPSARLATDLGRAAADTPLTGLSVRFNMSDTQQAALTQLLSDQQNPASPRYHQWLTPEQFAGDYGLAPADLQKVSSWLASQGFSAIHVARGGTFISFSGTAAQAENAFHTQLHRVSLNGENHIANLTSPALPSAIAAVASGITGLDDFRPKSHLRHLPAVVSGDALSPHYTSTATGNHFVVPGDFYTIYDVNPLLTQGVNGTGVSIAVIGEIDINASDIATFRSLGGLSVNPPTTIVAGSDPGQPANDANDLLESELDVEWAGAAAPSAQILFVTGPNVFNDSLTYAIDQNLAPIISSSYGECESDAQQGGDISRFSPLIQQANAQGQTVVASAGDDGATDCETAIATIASHGLAVDFPAVLPYVTGIGGTTFNDLTNPSMYWGPANGNAATALSYIPEGVWNESVSGGDLSSGGGGVSLYFAKPSWQAGTGVPADGARDVPDVSLNAALLHDATLICTPGYCTGGKYTDASLSHDIVGGTSVGAPQFAGLLALVVQNHGRLGNANPTIYALANSAAYGNIFHDVTTGNNASPCRAGTTDCPSGGSIGYSATAGYDLASGWGSVDANYLVNSWSSVTPSPSTITLTGTPLSATQGTNINLTATVSSYAAVGNVQFLLDNVAVGSPVALNSGVATYPLSTTGVSAGVHTVQATYLGDAGYAASTASITVNIASATAPDFTLTASTTNVFVSSGTSAAGVTFTVRGLNSFSGTVQLTATAVSKAGYTLTPSQITLSPTTTSGTATLTFSAFTAAARMPVIPGASSRPETPPWYEAGSGVALAGMLMLVLPRRRRYMGALVALLTIGLFAATGCGGGGAVTSTATTTTTVSANGAPVGNYTITVTGVGTSGATIVTHTAVVNYVVQ